MPTPEEIYKAFSEGCARGNHQFEEYSRPTELGILVFMRCVICNHMRSGLEVDGVLSESISNHSPLILEIADRLQLDTIKT